MASRSALARELAGMIRFRGPVTFAEYMRQCLTHPVHGYYMRRDVFGRRGDFITGPEISQVFGELVGVWCVAMWQQLGEPRALRVVEAGPGRGTLMADMLRVISRHEPMASATSIELIEVSPFMREAQRVALADDSDSTAPPRTRLGGMPIAWHDSVRDLVERERQDASSPPPPCLFVAHEFLDALPVHKFSRARPDADGLPGEWREVLVDVADDEAADEAGVVGQPDAGSDARAAPPDFRLVLAPGPTPALAALRSLLPARSEAPDGVRAGAAEEVELCPLAHAFVHDVGEHIAAHRGGALLIDYGPASGRVSHSARAIVEHQFVPLLERAGEADLSALVDFGALSGVARENEGLAVSEVATQRSFLGAMGLEARVNALLTRASAADARALVAAAHRLVAAPGMGEEYKALGFSDKATGGAVGFPSGSP